MTQVTKVAIVGAGGMLRYHVQGFRQAGAEVVAITDPDIQRCVSAATDLRIVTTFSDFDRLLTEVECDAVSIITPNVWHKPLAEKALLAGKHVFCEKPPALNAIEVAEMIGIAKTAEKRLMFNFNNRHRPEALILKRAIEQGQQDPGSLLIRAAQANWIRRRGIPGFGGWFTDKEQAGGGALIDLLHMVDLALWFMSYPMPSYVLGSTNNDFGSDPSFKGPWGIRDGAGPMNVETAAHGFVMFEGKQSLYLRCSWAEMNQREEVSVNFQGSTLGACLRRLFGQDGLDETAKDSLTIIRPSQNEEVKFSPDPTMGRVASAAHFIRVIDGLEQPLSTPDEALTLMRIIDAVYQSAHTGEPICMGGRERVN